MQKIKYSERLGEISDLQIQEALTKHNLGKLLKTTPITQGLFGQNLFLTSTEGDYVLRGVPHYDWQFPKEKFFASELHSRTSVPVPYPYIYDNDKRIFGWDFVLMPRLKGRGLSDNIDDTDLSEEDRVAIANAQGKILSQLQELRYEYSGNYDLQTNSIKSFENGYFSFLESTISERINQCRSYNQNTTQEDIEWIREILECNKKYFENFQPVYVMQDFKPGNMVVDKDNGTWQVTGIFDLMEGYVGFGESDISRMFSCYIKQNRADLAQVFVKSYLANNPGIKIEEFIDRFPLFIIMDRIIIWEWYQRHGKANEISFQNWIEPYLDLELEKTF